ncbi:hypothetical protein BAOM_5079 [Peribacillus asahii]|uniref:Uncharacterized protein n=1 Tax=Peribacillus asahii TaxID=228899 RepID=A0A3Q9RSA3_9BACI|nr:hypothetical protein BAOM_5079 [Peribacillus asahii]
MCIKKDYPHLHIPYSYTSIEQLEKGLIYLAQLIKGYAKK